MTSTTIKRSAAMLAVLSFVGAAQAGVSAAEAAKLKGELTPLGAERAGNRDGSIPAWTGGLTTATQDFRNGGRRTDPFASEKATLQITSKNMDQFADKLTEGTKVMLPTSSSRTFNWSSSLPTAIAT